MVRTGFLAAALCWIALADGLHAQSGILGPPPSLNLQPVDTSRAMSSVTSTTSNALTAPRTRSPRFFSMGNFFPTISVATWPPRLPNVFTLPQGNNPYQPNPPGGVNPFAAATGSNRPGSVISVPGKAITKPTK